MLIEKVIDAKKKKIRLHPTHVNRASEIGHQCLRYLVFKRVRWQDATLHDVDLQFVFDEGHLQERAVIRDLEDAGWSIIEQQRDYFWAEFQLSAHLDGKVVLENEANPIEVKSMSQFVWVKINTIDDLKNARMPHLQKYPAQLNVYNLLSNSHRGFLILKNKSTGQLKEIEVPLDYEAAETLLKKCEAINDHVKQGTVPAPIPYSESMCGRCPFLHICLPDVKREALDLTDDPELEIKLKRRAELAPLRSEYETLDEEVKEMVREKEKIVCGDFLIRGRYQDRKDSKKVWITTIEQLTPQKGLL
jgi:CRISPR/Cas system-associated exonuclease Cas4 (RecB family)